MCLVLFKNNATFTAEIKAARSDAKQATLTSKDNPKLKREKEIFDRITSRDYENAERSRIT